MERTIKLVLAYDGGDFHGWQRQRDVRTVQQDVEDVARRVLREPVHLVGASRTDSGVHAAGQVAHVRTRSPIPVENMRRAISHRLARDVTIVYACEAPRAFHATQSAIGKLYRYRIYNNNSRPVEQLADRHCWHVWFPLDADAMRAGAARICGTHDFSAFESAGSPRQSSVRTVTRIGIRRRLREVLIDVQGDGFLYNQVRNMVGTLVEVGRGHWAPETMTAILASRDRSNAGPTAPPGGLCLQWVRYPPHSEMHHGS
jgi:tRNA pseudouridine38-40 synthase